MGGDSDLPEVVPEGQAVNVNAQFLHSQLSPAQAQAQAHAQGLVVLQQPPTKPKRNWSWRRPPKEDDDKMLRKNSSSKWKQVLGFDDGVNGTLSSTSTSTSSTGSRAAPPPKINTDSNKKHSSSRTSVRSKNSNASKISVASPIHEFPASSPSSSTKPIIQPPAYEYSDAPEVVPNSTDSISESSPVVTSPTITGPYPRLPRDITFYRKRQDFLLAPSPPAPSPHDRKPLPAPPHLFYITIQQDESPWEYTRKPDIIMHMGPSQSAPILSYVEFHTATMKADITLCPYGSESDNNSTEGAGAGSKNSSATSNFSFPTPPPAKPKPDGVVPQFKTERLNPMGGIFTPEKYAFCHALPRSFVRERFEWRYSSGPFIRTQDGQKESGGLKLIRVTTGETVAVYAGLGNVSNNDSPVVGMFRFLVGDSLVNLGEEFEILAVQSILTVVEKQRRAVIASKAAFGIN